MDKNKIILAFVCIAITLISGCGSGSTSDVDTIVGSVDEFVEPTSTDEATSKIEVPDNPSFRNTVWGMTKDEVKQLETLETIFSEDEHSIFYYPTEIVNMDAIPCYAFDDEGKLYRGVYLFDVEHSNENLYIDDFDNVVEALTSKYGAPDSNKKNWKDDLYEDDPDDWGFAVSIGDLSFEASWKTDNTLIWVTLNGDNYDLHVALYYDSLTYERVDNSKTNGL